MTTVVIGAGSKIAQEFKKLVPASEQLVRGSLDFADSGVERYLICSGFLTGQLIGTQTHDQMIESFTVNFIEVTKYCDAVFSRNENARVCVIGSESGYKGSYDMVYAGAKAALHLYVETKNLSSGQQLVCISPGIIEDAGMTTRRQDIEILDNLRQSHPKGRFLKSAEVAKLAYFLFYEDEGYITNTVIRMHGGKRQ